MAAIQSSTAARNAISPLLEALVQQLDASGHPTQGAYFNRIRRDLDHAQDDLALLMPIRALSTAHIIGVTLPEDSAPLLQRISDKAGAIAAVLDQGELTRH